MVTKEENLVTEIKSPSLLETIINVGEVVLKEKKYSTTKEVEIELNDSKDLETALEINYTSLKLNKLPIVYQNFSKKIDLEEIVPVGTSALQIGNIVIPNVSSRFLCYKNFKILEFKTREFKIGFSVDLQNGEIFKSGDYFEYEIFYSIKNIRYKAVVDIIHRIFSGEFIYFEFNKLSLRVAFPNSIEAYKFSLIKGSLNYYENITRSFSLRKEKNFSLMNASFYELLLLEKLIENESLDTWTNLKIKVNQEINVGDRLTVKRIHKINLLNLNFDIEEIISFKEELKSSEIREDEINCNRKAASILLKKIAK